MSAVSDFRQRVEKAFEPTSRGVLGLVDDLLALGGHDGLVLNWHDGRCCVRTLHAEPLETTEVRVPKSVFRAVLARVATLCNERTPDSVTPYGGEGEISAPASPDILLRVTYANRPGEQRLQVKPV